MWSERATPSILDIGTATPPYRCTAEETVAIARQVFAGQPATIGFVERVVRGSQIDCRQTVIADYGLPREQRTFFPKTPDLRPEPGTARRNEVFHREASALALAACARLELPGWQPRVTHVLTASCTGFSAPGFDIALVRKLGLSPHVQRTHVGFMGCYAGFTTLKLARQICRAEPSALVLIVHVELCSLHVRFSPEPDTLVANCIFGDGAGAALVGMGGNPDLAGQTPLAMLGAHSTLLPEGDSDMTWNIGDHGFRMTLSPRVPHLVSKYLPTAFHELLQALAIPREAIRHWAVHPGGVAILDHAAKALQLAPDDLAVARRLLREHGNMSSATLWFLLDRLRRAPGGILYACGFGPGLTLESAAFSSAGG